MSTILLTSFFTIYMIGLMIIGFRQMRLISKLIEKKVEITGFEMYQFYWPFKSKKNLEREFAKTDEDKLLIKRIFRLRTLSWILTTLLLIFFEIIIFMVIIMQ